MARQARISIFCGKGGVGKTTLCLAAALRSAMAGRKVLAITSHPLPELALSLSLKGLENEHPAAAARLFVVHLDPRELLAGAVRENFPVTMLSRAILNSSIYQNLIEVAPGLKELFFLSRLQQLAEQRGSEGPAGQPEFDLLFWDCPATGHFLSTLRSGRDFGKYVTGPFARAGAELDRFFSSADSVNLLPVSTLEEMAITETAEMCAALREEFRLTPPVVLLNLASPLLAADSQEAESLCEAAASSRLPDAALLFAARRALRERDFARQIASLTGSATGVVQRQHGWSSDIDLLVRIGRRLEELIPAGCL